MRLDSLTKESAPSFAKAFDEVQRRIVLRLSEPLFRIVEIFSNDGRKHRRNVEIIRSFVLRIVEDRLVQSQVSNPSSDESTPKSDLLGYLMNAPHPSKSLPHSPSDLATYVLNYMVAGRDSTTNALAWTILMVYRNQRVKKRLFDEIDAVFGANSSGDEDGRDMPSYEEVKGMRYATAVFRETLRLYPPISGEQKCAAEADIIPTATNPTGVYIPRNTQVCWMPYMMGRSKNIWGIDAEQFRPERWLEMEKQPSPFAYTVFNAGPRACLGKSMAELHGVFIFACLMRRFDFEVLDHESVTYEMSLTLPIKDGLKVRVIRRK